MKSQCSTLCKPNALYVCVYLLKVDYLYRVNAGIATTIYSKSGINILVCGKLFNM